MKSKNYLLFISFYFICFLGNAQSPNWLWANAIGGAGDDKANNCVVDEEGNVYVIGFFRGTVDFDPSPSTNIINGTTSNNLFITKSSSSGNLIWAKALVGSNSLSGVDNFSGFSRDKNGNFFITGGFLGTVDFDPGIPINNLTSIANSRDIFVLKLDQTCNFVWVKQMGGNNTDFALHLEIDKTGNIYTTGPYTYSCDFDPGPGVYALSSGSGSSTFISKLDSAGNFLWAKQLEGGAYITNRTLSVDGANNIIVGGWFGGTTDFDPNVGSFYKTSVNNSGFGGGGDAFILKLDSGGNFVWVKTFGGPLSSDCFSLVTDSSSNIYSTGFFYGTIDFDPGIGVSTLTNIGSSSVFVTKLDSAGNFIWAKHIGGGSNSYAISNINKLDSLGNIFVGGNFNGNVDFNPGIGVDTSTAYLYNAFIVKLDSMGNFIWVKSFGGNDGGASIIDIALGENNDVYGCGIFNCTSMIFDYASLFNADRTHYEGFIVKLSCSSPATLNLNECSSYISPSGNYLWNASGIYFDTIPNVAGCDSMLTINLNITQIDTSIIQNSLTLTSPNSSASYQWLDCSNNFTPIAGATDSTYLVALNGSYAVKITKGSCIDTSICITITNVGIHEINVLENIKIVPNPAHSELKLDNVGSIINKVEIYTLTGQIVYSSISNVEKNNFNKINIEELLQGFYLVKIYSNSFTKTIKLMIE